MGLSTSNPIRHEYHGLIRSDIYPLIEKTTGTLLDVGGGTGETAASLKKMGMVGKAGVVDLVNQNADSLGLDFHYCADLEAPEALEKVMDETGPFAVILCLDVLEHLRDPWDLIARLHRQLEPGGVIIASIPNVRYYQASLPLFFQGKWNLTDRGILDRTHLRWFVRSTAIELMTSSGLVLEAVVEKPGGGRKIKLIRALMMNFGKSFTNLQYLIRVRNTF